MSFSLTVAERASLEAELATKNAQVASLTLAEVDLAAEIINRGLQEDGYKKLFEFYDGDIIKHYHDERESLNGYYVDTPIVEVDITNCASGSGRILPTFPTTNPVRINQFDQTPLIITGNEADNEEYFISQQSDYEGYLVSGFGGTDPLVTATSLTNSALTSTSTTLSMIDAAGPMTFAVGDIFVVQDGGTSAAVVEVTGVTDNLGGDPPYDWTLDIDIIVAPGATIASGSGVTVPFNGFSNADRTAKTATDPNLQPLMDSMISILEGHINSRISKLDEQIASLALNEDPDLAASADTNCDTSRAALVSYLTTTLISNAGLLVLSTERGVRSPQVTARLSAITAAYTGGTTNFLDARYNSAKDRCNTMRGTLVMKNSAQDSKDNIDDLKTDLQSSIASITAMLAL